MTNLGEAGQRLFDSLVAEGDPEAVRRLALEAARLADRGDQLDLLVRGDVDTWAVLVHKVQTDSYELKIDSALSEARQNATALRGIVAEVLKLKPPATGADDDDDCNV
ncbi:hypothetical protein QSJ18_18260 [Gordonia sp. ABSL1-1]|uniref:hypothetical protein n=1 Tax=Gordonia sp. ABSL1-1 TaxID=3053923 RepID=UPI0025731FF7|nr:hypothetical protein [Gordonia sp. ABSL1-1]MDL9938694.1 hypothetical protein [Gordonia sp. ABSL1-1]